MRNPRLSSLPFLPAVLAAALVAGAGAVQAQGGGIPSSADASSIYRRATGIDDSGDYRRELQACRSGRPQQDMETCLK
jgi:hypothetical protein